MKGMLGLLSLLATFTWLCLTMGGISAKTSHWCRGGRRRCAECIRTSSIMFHWPLRGQAALWRSLNTTEPSNWKMKAKEYWRFECCSWKSTIARMFPFGETHGNLSAVAIMGSQYRTWICNRVLSDISKQKHSMERKNSKMPIMVFIVAGLNSVGLMWTQFINLKLRYQDFPWFSSIGLGNSHLWCWSIGIYDLSSIAAWPCTLAERRKHVRACDQNTLKWRLHGPRTCPSIQRIDHMNYYGTVNLPHTRVV